MANKDRPAGLKPIKHINGIPWNGKFNMYYKAAGLAEAIFIGTPVMSAGSADSTGKYPTIKLAGQAPARGVVVGFSNTPYLAADLTDLDLLNSPVNTAHYVAVVDDPQVIFEAQEDNDSADLAATSAGANVNLTTESGNTTTGISTVEIDSSSEATTSTLQVKLLRLVDRPDNALGSHSKWEIMFNQHELGQGLGAAGV